MPKGAGRKPTGKKTKQYCITFSENYVAEIEGIAAQKNKNVNKFIRDVILEEYVYPNIEILPDIIDEPAVYNSKKQLRR